MQVFYCPFSATKQTAMKELTIGWKLFRLLCILQLIAVGLQLILSAGGLFNRQHILFLSVSVIIYLIIFSFVYQGLLLINYNYPETPLGPKQKKVFNWLYLLNFLAIAFLFGQLISQWKLTVPFLKMIHGGWLDWLLFSFSLLQAGAIFAFHILFLIGMYLLRRVIYQNTIESWQEQFSDSEKK